MNNAWIDLQTVIKVLLMSFLISLNFCFEALALKGIDYETHPVHLLKDGGQQVSAGI